MNRQYIGARYVPVFADPIEWNNQKVYEALTIVTYMETSYTSRKRVPAGVLPTNNEYWAVTGNYNAQVELYRQEVEKLKAERPNIKSFGAVGDGVTDDLPALNAFISYITENNVEGYVPEGVYYLNGTLVYNGGKPVRFRGAGIDKTIFKGAGVKSVLGFSKTDYISVSDFTIDGNSDYTAQGSVCGLNIQISSNVFVERVKGVNCNSYAMWVIAGGDTINVNNAHFEKCCAEHCYSGIQIQGATNSSISNCYAKHITGTGVAFKTPIHNSTMNDITTEDCSYEGVNVGSSYPELRATSCLFNNITCLDVGNGFSLSSCDNCIVDNIMVTIKDTLTELGGGNGIGLNASKNNYATNVHVRNCANAVVRLSNTDGDCEHNYVKVIEAVAKAGGYIISYNSDGTHVTQNNIVEVPAWFVSTVGTPFGTPTAPNYVKVYGGSAGVAYHRVTAEGGAINAYNTANDYLCVISATDGPVINTINGGYLGRKITLQASSTSFNVTLTNGGNIAITDNVTISTTKLVTLIYTEDDTWVPIN